MCGRYMVTASRKQLAARFAAQDALGDAVPRAVVAPGQVAAVVTTEHKLEPQRWGLQPEWEAHGALLINARAETLLQKPTFRGLLAQQRCLIPANGFFEWEKLPTGKKRALVFWLADRRVLALAGLWVALPDGSQRTFTIITTAANATVRPIHDRMPALLTPEAETAWLDPAQPPDAVLALLRPYTGPPLQIEEGALLLAPPPSLRQPLLPF